MDDLDLEERALLASWKSDVQELIESRISRMLPSEWAERKRILPPGLTSIPGPFRWETTPYLKEIIDCFSPTSQVQKCVIMKGSQLGFSVGLIENLIGWIIDVEPGPTLFVSADKELSQAVVELRVDRMIESAGLSHKIFAQVEKRHGKKTGDTKSKKEFAGGFLLPIGPNVAGKLRSTSIKTIFFDEVDGYPLEVGAEGDPISLAERRTDAFSRNRKILMISTPTTEDESRIKPHFESGDKSFYNVPCKHCGVEQILKWDGVKYDLDGKGFLVWDSVRYECSACGGAWKNDDKAFFLPRGRWIPTQKPAEPGLRSFHLSSLYSPVGFRSWESIVQEYVQIRGDVGRFRVFVNTVFGETWEDRGEVTQWERVMVRRENYLSGSLPDCAPVLLLTLGADVQKDRIECEVVGWCENKESFSVGYFVFHGDTSDIDGPAWRGLYGVLTREHCGMVITQALIDAGYNTTTVYQFCEQFGNGVFACMGESAQSYSKRLISIRPVGGYVTKRVDIQTGQFKSELYGQLNRNPPVDGESFPAGYCHFPGDYPEQFFKQLTAEKRVKEKTKYGASRWIWKTIRDRNEALDCRVYAMAALHVLVTLVNDGLDEDEAIDWPAFWSMVKGMAG